MSDNKFKHIYRIQSTRAQWWDYGSNAAYYITICTAHGERFFGNIINKKMHLSKIGVIANIFWHEIKKHANFVKLGEFIVMPDHIHGILIIDKPVDVSGIDDLNRIKKQSPDQKRFRNQGKNTISSIVGGYKSVVSNHAHRLGYDFAWQSRFYDHIIRDEDEYRRITDYIIKNPANWKGLRR